MHINIVSRKTGAGLDRDIDLLQATLTDAGHEVSLSVVPKRDELKSLARVFKRTPKYDMNIFLERAFVSWCGLADTNVLMPNQERFPKRHLPKLKVIDHVFCKTQHATDIFKQHHKSVHHVGFTSVDYSQQDMPPDFNRWLHEAGKSTLKGTDDLYALWAKHPEWPTLTVLQDAKHAPTTVPTNVKLITEKLSPKALDALQNQSGIHVCPSRSEGWGHCIVGGMALGIVTLTTDAPPMNELVTSERGVLINTTKSEPRHLGTNFFVDPKHLETQIETLINMSDTEKQALGQHARTWFLDNDKAFRTRLIYTLSKLQTH